MKKFFLGFGRGFWRREPSPFRVARSSGFLALDMNKRIEEERMPAYEKELYYPVRIGDVFRSRYQVISKLGFGANSTVWFCRDVQKHRYVALKVHIHSLKVDREVEILKHLSTIDTKHPGSGLVRSMLDAFEINGPKGSYQCIVFEPPLTSVLHFQATFDPPSLTEDLLKGLLQQLLLALDYLHSEAHVIHTDIQAKNIIISARDDSIFRDWEKSEEAEPTPRKLSCGNTIYQSRFFHRKRGWNGYGMPILSDFGDARIGDVHEGLIQPDIYRAPEVILGKKWTSKVDIWNVGTLVWDLFEDHHLFDGRGPDKQHSNDHLLAEMMAILGPPPAKFLRGYNGSQEYWNEIGHWKGNARIPDWSLEDLEGYLEGDNKVLFMQFMRKMLRWDPDERQTARELLMDPWLNTP
ncbi:kinase-like protein [Penicillium hispanicum]|uniref:kinase-like protein n=1 Tax=Penicillium hispanicum TaxID=1080232 RepID=UPI002541E8EF|nr:kinase-like protein [Penicillium hispanicum]KAJ5569564.1 kinase-like protein [Penicillium hispanicum]